MNSLCECDKPGYCPRYGRDMIGRFWEICRGINVDLGTAAHFREAWLREAPAPPVAPATDSIPLLLVTNQAPGDAVAMTAAIRSLHLAYPRQYLTAVKTPYPAVFQYNPDIVPARADSRPLQMHYPAIKDSCDRGIHFMQAWCEHLGAALGIHVPLHTNRPRLYFPDPPPRSEDFWLICAGVKSDFTAKCWHGYQEVVSSLKGKVRFVQVGAIEPGHDHPRLRGAEDMVGKTDLRQLFNLTRRAKGILCGVSLLMHVAAALEKPAIIVAGGREPVQWNAYPKQHYLHTIGMLSCPSWRGRIGEACWRSRLPQPGTPDKDICVRAHDGSAECMRLIRPEMVAELILRYNR